MSDPEPESNHYQTLRVDQNASQEEIRTAFRGLVKIYHPDRNPRRVAWAEARMCQLLEAYRVVSDAGQRATYDQRFRRSSVGATFARRMAKKKEDLGAQSKLVLHYLLQDEPERAIELHEKLTLRRVTFSLEHHLDDRDYLDSLFLLGEAYEGRKQWRTALKFYWKAYEREKNGPRKRYFFDELKDRLRVLFSQRLVRGLRPEDVLKNYRRALGVCGENRDAALIYKKIASVQSQLGRPAEAVKALDKAKELCPGMKAIDAMREKIAGA